MYKDGPQHSEVGMASATPCGGSPPSGRYLTAQCHLWSVMSAWLVRQVFQLAVFLGEAVLREESVWRRKTALVHKVIFCFTQASVSPAKDGIFC